MKTTQERDTVTGSHFLHLNNQQLTSRPATQSCVPHCTSSGLSASVTSHTQLRTSSGPSVNVLQAQQSCVPQLGSVSMCYKPHKIVYLIRAHGNVLPDTQICVLHLGSVPMCYQPHKVVYLIWAQCQCVTSHTDMCTSSGLSVNVLPATQIYVYFIWAQCQCVTSHTKL